MTTDLRREVNVTGIDSIFKLARFVSLLSGYQLHRASSLLNPPAPPSSPRSPLVASLPIFPSRSKPGEHAYKFPLPHAPVHMYLSAAAAASLLIWKSQPRRWHSGSHPALPVCARGTVVLCLPRSFSSFLCAGPLLSLCKYVVFSTEAQTLHPSLFSTLLLHQSSFFLSS